MMIYIHGKDWDAKLLEALISERMKPSIIEKTALEWGNSRQLQCRAFNSGKNMNESKQRVKCLQT